MLQLMNNYKPSNPLIRFIEVIGIIINTQIENTHTQYKISLPSNYVETINAMDVNLDGILQYIISLKIVDISNEIVEQIYSKTNEDNFDFERAYLDGGFELNAVFNATQEVLIAVNNQSLENSCGISVNGCDIMVVMTNNKSSYNALDVASHILGFGFCNVQVYIDETIAQKNIEQTIQFLSRDILRRCQNQYKMLETNYSIDLCIAQGNGRTLSNIKESFQTSNTNKKNNNNSKILCIGMENSNIGLDCKSPLLLWAVWTSDIDVILTPSHAYIKPFNIIKINFIIQIYYKLNSNDNIIDLYKNCLKFIRPKDFIVFVIHAEKRVSVGDNRDTRFEYGKRLQWYTEDIPPNKPYYSDDTKLDNLIIEVQNLLVCSKIDGIVRAVRESIGITIDQILCKVALEEKSDLIILKSNNDNKSLVIKCVQDSPCSVAIIK